MRLPGNHEIRIGTTKARLRSPELARAVLSGTPMSTTQTESTCGIEVAMSTSQGHRRELIQTLEGLKDRISESEPDCACEVFEDLAVANRFLWSEWWPSSQECRDAETSDRFRALLGAIKVLGSLESVRHVSRTSEGDRKPTSLNQMKRGPKG